MKTKSEKNKALKRVERAIDAMVDLMDMGFGTGDVQRVLDSLNHIRSQIENERWSIFGL